MASLNDHQIPNFTNWFQAYLRLSCFVLDISIKECRVVSLDRIKQNLYKKATVDQFWPTIRRHSIRSEVDPKSVGKEESENPPKSVFRGKLPKIQERLVAYSNKVSETFFFLAQKLKLLFGAYLPEILWL